MGRSPDWEPEVGEMKSGEKYEDQLKKLKDMGLNDKDKNLARVPVNAIRVI